MLKAYLAVFVVAPFAYSTAFGRTCGEWIRREVPTFEASDYDVLRTAARTATFEIPLLPAGLDGVTIPGATLVTSGGDGDVVLHEAIHHLQMERDGLVRYSARYVREWVNGVYHGCGPFDSYRAISYEVQARRAVNLYPDHVVAQAELGNGRQFVDTLTELHADGQLVSMLNEDEEPWLEEWISEWADGTNEAWTDEEIHGWAAADPTGHEPSRRDWASSHEGAAGTDGSGGLFSGRWAGEDLNRRR